MGCLARGELGVSQQPYSLVCTDFLAFSPPKRNKTYFNEDLSPTRIFFPACKRLGIRTVKPFLFRGFSLLFNEHPHTDLKGFHFNFHCVWGGEHGPGTRFRVRIPFVDFSLSPRFLCHELQPKKSTQAANQKASFPPEAGPTLTLTLTIEVLLLDISNNYYYNYWTLVEIQISPPPTFGEERHCL